MARKTRRQTVAPPIRATPPISWLVLVMTALAASAIGALVTYLAGVKPLQRENERLTRQVASLRSSPAPTGMAESPAPELTAGLSPAQAALKLGNWYLDHANPNAVKAVSFYNAAIRGGVDNPDVRTDYGIALRLLGQPREALKQFALAQKQNPKHENSLFNQGVVYAFDLNDTPKAVAAWRAYVARFPQGQHVAEAQQLIAQVQSAPAIPAPAR